MPQVSDLVATSEVLGGLALENSVRLPLVRDLHQHALAMLLDGRTPADPTSVQLMGAELDEQAQRAALERAFRSLAKLAATDEDRYALVDQANACRPSDVDMSTRGGRPTPMPTSRLPPAASPPSFTTSSTARPAGCRVSQEPPAASPPALSLAGGPGDDRPGFDRRHHRPRSSAPAQRGRVRHRCSRRPASSLPCATGSHRRPIPTRRRTGRRRRRWRCWSRCSIGRPGRRPNSRTCSDRAFEEAQRAVMLVPDDEPDGNDLSPSTTMVVGAAANGRVTVGQHRGQPGLLARRDRFGHPASHRRRFLGPGEHRRGDDARAWPTPTRRHTRSHAGSVPTRIPSFRRW